MKLPFAIDIEGKLVEIKDVVSGLACNCICPHCKAKLIARKGDLKIHHFAHKGDECLYATQTALHLAAKEILSKTDFFTLPSLYVSSGSEMGPKILLYNESEVKLESVILEKRFHTIIPDLILASCNFEIILEIRVTHSVNAIKLDKIKSYGIAALEIDLSKLERQISKDLLKDILIKQTNLKSWLFHPTSSEISRRISKFYSYRKVTHDNVVQNCPRSNGYSVNIKRECLKCDCFCSNIETGLNYPAITCIGHKIAEVKEILDEY